MTRITLLCIFLVYLKSINCNAQSGFDFVFITPKDSIKKHEKLELGLKLSSTFQVQVTNFLNGQNGLNPFDPDHINIIAEFIAPSSKSFLSYGFYYSEFKKSEDQTSWNKLPTTHDWRLRFSPKETGVWRVNVKIYISGSLVYTYGYQEFTCVNSSSKGHLEIGRFKKNLRYSELQESFFAIGENLCWADNPNSLTQLTPDYVDTLKKYISELRSNGGNYTEFFMNNSNFSLEREHLGDYSKRLHLAWEFDEVIQHCEDLGIYFQICILSSGFSTAVSPTPEAGIWADDDWLRNPYNLAFNLSSTKNFFTNQYAIAQFKKYIKYVISRWGYSSNWTTIELVNEADNKADYFLSSNNRDNFIKWQEEISAYIKFELDQRYHFITSSFSKRTGDEDCIRFWNSPLVDIANSHHYGSNEKVNYKQRFELAEQIQRKIHKPHIFDEIGSEPLVEVCSDISFHNAIWATSFMGSFGCGMNWWWDNVIHPNGYHENFRALSDFFSDIDFEKEKLESKKNHLPGIFGSGYENYYLINDSKSFCAGWVHNRDFYWKNMGYRLPCVYDLEQYDGGIAPRSDDKQKLLLFSFSPLKRYIIQWFDTRNNGELIHSSGSISSLTGELSFSIPETNEYHPDYAYKIFSEGTYNAFDIFPNPSNGEFFISSKHHESVTIEIYNSTGSLMLIQETHLQNEVRIDLSDQNRGVYIVRIYFQAGVFSERVVIL